MNTDPLAKWLCHYLICHGVKGRLWDELSESYKDVYRRDAEEILRLVKEVGNGIKDDSHTVH
jgi:hypothetical protein